MSITERPKVGVGVFVWNGRQVLMGQRQGAHGEGTWAPPGGKPDGGETPLDAAARELTEETGLKPLGLRPVDFWTYDRFETDDLHYVTLYFQCVWDGRAPIVMEPEKCLRWKWFPISELPHPLFPGVAEASDWFRSR